MEIILTQEIYKLGHPGDVVKVADGYARNYLLPQNIAIMATPGNLKKIEGIRTEAEAQRQAQLSELRAQAAKLRGVMLEFTRKADENGHLYGSVSEIDIVTALAEQDIEINKTTVVLDKHIKQIGEIEVSIHLAREVDTFIKVKVFDEEGNWEMAVEEEPAEAVEVEVAVETVESEIAVTLETEEPEAAEETAVEEPVSEEE
ncbi:MAG: 50S ribosomal protein L9 [Candidatus Cloacimonetes bacterium]|nr:50S ribosomal protein L9 [Candidatus Cloacimonadota bacterium]